MCTLKLPVENDDYVAGPHTVVFNTLGVPLPTQGCTSIATINDVNVEGPHDFTVQITAVSLPNSVTIESPSQQNAIIIDNDGTLAVLEYTHIYSMYPTTLC